jgi:hypothetical protein
MPQILVDGGGIRQVIADDGVDVRQAQRIERLDDPLGRLAPLECVDYQFQQHPALADTKNARRFSYKGMESVSGCCSRTVMVSIHLSFLIDSRLKLPLFYAALPAGGEVTICRVPNLRQCGRSRSGEEVLDRAER